MKTQHDSMVRSVLLGNLEAICERVSGFCHRFWVEKVTRSRVWVGYSNPNEYGRERPMFLVLPSYPSSFEPENPYIVFDILRVVYDTWDGEGHQAFHPVLDCPVLWRDPADGVWRTQEEIDNKRGTVDIRD